MKKVYCEVSSLNELKNLISKKQDITCVERNLFNPNGYITYHSIYNLNVDDIVALEKSENGGCVAPYEWVLWNGSNISFPDENYYT